MAVLAAEELAAVSRFWTGFVCRVIGQLLIWQLVVATMTVFVAEDSVEVAI